MGFCYWFHFYAWKIAILKTFRKVKIGNANGFRHAGWINIQINIFFERELEKAGTNIDAN